MKITSNYFDKLYDYLIDYGIANEDEISLVTNINGINDEALNDILYVRMGYNDLYQALDIDDDELDDDELDDDELDDDKDLEV